MDFYDYATTHDLTRRAGLTNDTPAAFYRQVQAAAYAERARGVKGMAVEFNRYQSELDWTLGGRPYYKFWPAIIPLLAGVGIDVPVDYLRLPFPAFLMRFTVDKSFAGWSKWAGSSGRMLLSLAFLDGSYNRVLKLRSPFGGGKSHTLASLLHAARSRKSLNQIAECMDFADPGKVDVAAMLEAEGRPVLLLLDEVLKYMERAAAVGVKESTLQRQAKDFLQNLTVEVPKSRHALIRRRGHGRLASRRLRE